MKCERVKATDIESLPDDLLSSILVLPTDYLHRIESSCAAGGPMISRSDAFVNNQIQHSTIFVDWARRYIMGSLGDETGNCRMEEDATQHGFGSSKVEASSLQQLNSTGGGKAIIHSKPLTDEKREKMKEEMIGGATQGGSKRTKNSKSGAYTSSSNPTTPNSDDCNPNTPTSGDNIPTMPFIERPMGQKAAKRKGKGKIVSPPSVAKATFDKMKEVAEARLEKWMRLHVTIKRLKKENSS
ncbi:hypothetical protein OROGR_026655 [Orobanche gracilis]